MPYSPLGPCIVNGCPERAVTRGRCARHAKEAAARYRAAHGDPRPSAAKRGYDAAWRKIRDEFIVHHPFCATCGKIGEHVDHIKPLADGGTHDESNLQTLCASCHSRKTSRHDGAFHNKRSTVPGVGGGKSS